MGSDTVYVGHVYATTIWWYPSIRIFSHSLENVRVVSSTDAYKLVCTMFTKIFLSLCRLTKGNPGKILCVRDMYAVVLKH
jgi:hypothetical protein